MKAIMYHYVRSSDPKLPYFRYLNTKNFIKQLDYFEKEYGFVSYEEFLGILKGFIPFENVQNKIILTFDDGFKDHYTNVLPELKKRNLFGIFYIPTGVYLKQKALDVHRIHYLLGKVGGQKLMESANRLIQPHMLNQEAHQHFEQYTYTLQNNDQFTQRFKQTFNYYLKYKYRETLLDTLVKEFSSDQEIFSDLYLCIEDLKTMDREGMVIGSHGVNHLVFSKLSLKQQNYEIYNSFNFLKNILGEMKIKTFCYPYGGVNTFTLQTISLLNKCKADFSFTTNSGEITQESLFKDPQTLTRYDCNRFPYGEASLG